MIGINRHTGRAIAGDAHLAQSILDILMTPKVSQPKLRGYGSDVPAIIAQPLNGETIVDLYQAVAEALDEWEPRLDLARIAIHEISAGKLTLDLIDQDGELIQLPLEVLS